MKNKRKCIALLAEDDPVISKMYQKKFALSGFEVINALDGEEAIKLSMAHKPDIIFLDILMPKISGLQALEAMKKIDLISDIPVVVITNSTQINDAKKAKKMGAASFLIKTAQTPSEVVATTKKIVCSKCPQRCSMCAI